MHRDLKPANVLLAADGPRVIDFGISLAAEASAADPTGLVVGSPGFMSPEQAEGREVGPSSDIFSLGAVLAFAATGQGPFGTGSTPALVYRVVHSPPNLDHLADVRPLVERCLDKDPGRRPTARDLLAGPAVHPPRLAARPGDPDLRPVPGSGGRRGVRSRPGGGRPSPGRARCVPDRHSGQDGPGLGAGPGGLPAAAAAHRTAAGRRVVGSRPGGGLGRRRLRPDRLRASGACRACRAGRPSPDGRLAGHLRPVIGAYPGSSPRTDSGSDPGTEPSVGEGLAHLLDLGRRLGLRVMLEDPHLQPHIIQ